MKMSCQVSADSQPEEAIAPGVASIRVHEISPTLDLPACILIIVAVNVKSRSNIHSRGTGSS